jgi:hypothetical protein
MIHPLFRLLASQPHMLAEHLEAYSNLVAEELQAWQAHWQRRALLLAVALGAALVAVILAGVAAMLWAVTPASNWHAPWVLLAAPGVPALLALGCLLSARASAPEAGAFGQIRQQLAADVAMLREASSS